MPLRIVSVPPVITITITTDRGPQKQKATFIAFIETLLNQKGWEANFASIRAASSIHTAFSDDAEVVTLAEEDWKRLKRCIEAPEGGSVGLMPEAARQLVPYFEAVMDAEEHTEATPASTAKGN